MSAFIDSMVTPEESERLETHLIQCEPCQRQLQSFISIRNLLARIEQPAPPQDMVLETRVKLSQERNRNAWDRVESQLNNVFRPLAVPAVSGILVTALCFAILVGSLGANTTVNAQPEFSGQLSDGPSVPLYQPVRTTEPTMVRFKDSDSRGLKEPLMIEVHVNDDGRAVDYHIISGAKSPAVDRWLEELLFFSQFTPAMAFGKPVESKIILSFVAVRS